MKILQFLQECFCELPNTPNIKKWIQNKRELINDDEEFFYQMIQRLGGRGYNDFLDYGLMAIKVGRWLKCCYETDKFGGSISQKAVNYLLFDDRHDLYQNLPYVIKDLEGYPDKWKTMTDILIDCINLEGTGDVTYKFKISE